MYNENKKETDAFTVRKNERQQCQTQNDWFENGNSSKVLNKINKLH